MLLTASLWGLGMVALVACSGEAGSVAVPDPSAVPGGKGDGARDAPGPLPAPDPDAVTPGLVTRTMLTRVALATDLSFGGRGSNVLCPDPQTLRIGGVYLSRLTKDGDRTSEIASLCSLDVPGFVVSAHGGLGGCDQTREARLEPGFDIAEVARKSILDVPLADLESMPVSFVLGAALDDAFSEPLPDWSTPAQWRDDDADGKPGVTLLGTGLPILPDGSELYAAVRLLVTPTTPGHAEASLELSLLGSNAGLSGHTLEFIAPDLRAGLVVTYSREEVPDDFTCADSPTLAL